MTIESNAFVLFGRDTCPYCLKAAKLLKDKGYPLAYVNLIDHPSLRLSDWKTVPQIFYKSNHIGGYTELASYLESEDM